MFYVLAVFVLVVDVLTYLPPAAQVLAISAVVYAVLQAAKKSPWLGQYITGWLAIALNVALTALAVIATIPAASLYSAGTIQTLLTTILLSSTASAGIHGTVRLMGPGKPITNPVAKK